MENQKSSSQDLMPFISLFAVCRRESLPLPGKYDEDLHLSVVEKAGGKVPLVNAYASQEIFTKTEATRESDEDDHRAFFLEMTIKTNVQRESDADDEKHPSEFLTKTFADRESDDDDKFFLAELMTKTAVHREGDDNEFEIQ